MTDSSDRIKELEEKGPKAVLTRSDQVFRWALVITASITLVLIVGYFANKEATSNVAACTNQNLGARNEPATADANAHIVWAQANEKWVAAINTVLADPPNSPQSAADYATFLMISSAYQVATDSYEATLKADAAQRAANPLGKC